MLDWTTKAEDSAQGPAPDELDILRRHLPQLQTRQIAHRKRAIILFEGSEGSGKKYALRQLSAAFDPCHFEVHPIGFDRRQSSEGHWLARFWRALPSASDTAIFYRSWYRRVLDDRIHGRVDEPSVVRAFDEINEFEAQQRDYGTLIVKLYFDVSGEVQDHRLRERATDPWLASSAGEQPVSVRDAAYRQAFADLKAHTDTRWSPWHIIDGDDEHEAAVAALGMIAQAWERAMPADPPHIVSAPPA